MKNVQIPYELFLDLVMYHLRGPQGRTAKLPLDYFALGTVTGACHAPVSGRQDK